MRAAIHAKLKKIINIALIITLIFEQPLCAYASNGGETLESIIQANEIAPDNITSNNNSTQTTLEDLSNTSQNDIEMFDTKLSADVGSYKISVEGSMPNGIKLRTNRVNASKFDNLEKTIEESVNIDNYEISTAFDIELLLNGQPWQPMFSDTTLNVSISGMDSADENLTLYRILDEEDVEEIKELTNQNVEAVSEINVQEFNDGTLTFDTDHFTTYVFGSTTVNTEGTAAYLVSGEEFINLLFPDSRAWIRSAKWSDDSSIALNPNAINITESGEPVYALLNQSKDKIEFYTNAEKVYLNENISYMFSRSSPISKYVTFRDVSFIEDSRIDTSLVKYANHTFDDCDLASLDLSNWNTPNLIEIKSMFFNIKTEYMDISNLDFSNVQESQNAFLVCYAGHLKMFAPRDLPDQVKEECESITPLGDNRIFYLDTNENGYPDTPNKTYRHPDINSSEICIYISPSSAPKKTFNISLPDNSTAFEIFRDNNTPDDNFLQIIDSLANKPISNIEWVNDENIISNPNTVIKSTYTDRNYEEHPLPYPIYILAEDEQNSTNIKLYTEATNIYTLASSYYVYSIGGIIFDNDHYYADSDCDLYKTLSYQEYSFLNDSRINFKYLPELRFSIYDASAESSNIVDFSNANFSTIMDEVNISDQEIINEKFNSSKGTIRFLWEDYSETSGSIRPIKILKMPPLSEVDFRLSVDSDEVYLYDDEKITEKLESDEGEYDLFSDNKSHTYIIIQPAYLFSGKDFNRTIKRLVDPDRFASDNCYGIADPETVIQENGSYKFPSVCEDTLVDIRWTDTPWDFSENTEIISNDGLEVYAHIAYDDDVHLDFPYIELYTEASKVYLNEDCSYMFSCFTKLQNMSFLSSDKIDASLVESTERMFANKIFYNNRTTYYSIPLRTDLDLSNLVMPNLENTREMFSGSSFSTLNISGWQASPTTINGMFKHNNKLTSIIGLSELDVSNATNFNTILGYCDKITSIDISSWNMSSAQNISSMFDTDRELAEVILPDSFLTNSVTNTSYTFGDCRSLTEVDTTNWDTSNVTNMGSMFAGCSKLTTLDVSNWDVSKVNSIYKIFSGCTLFDPESAGVGAWRFSTNKYLTMDYAFKGTATTTLDLSGWNLIDSASVNSMIDCPNLKEFYAPKSSIEITLYPLNDSSLLWYLDDDNNNEVFIDDETYTATIIDNNASHRYIRSDIEGFEVVTQLNTILLNGNNFNSTIKSLSPDAISIEWSDDSSIASDPEAINLALEGMIPVYAVKRINSDNKPIILVYSTADKVCLNEDSSRMFNLDDCLESCPFIEDPRIDTSLCINMGYMFYGCSKILSLDLSNWNTSNVTNMQYLLKYCNKLQSLDISNFNTSNVTNMQGMFHSCRALSSLDLSHFDTSNVSKINSMFQYCTSLTSIDLSNWDISNITDYATYIFDYCSLLNVVKAPKTILENSNSEIRLPSHQTEGQNWYLDDEAPFGTPDSSETFIYTKTGVTNKSHTYILTIPETKISRESLRNARFVRTSPTSSSSYNYRDIRWTDTPINPDNIGTITVSTTDSAYPVYGQVASVADLPNTRENSSDTGIILELYTTADKVYIDDANDLFSTYGSDKISTYTGLCNASFLTSKIDTSRCEDFKNMFRGCTSLILLDFSNLDIQGETEGMIPSATSKTTLYEIKMPATDNSDNAFEWYASNTDEYGYRWCVDDNNDSKGDNDLCNLYGKATTVSATPHRFVKCAYASVESIAKIRSTCLQTPNYSPYHTKTSSDYTQEGSETAGIAKTFTFPDADYIIINPYRQVTNAPTIFAYEGSDTSSEYKTVDLSNPYAYIYVNGDTVTIVEQLTDADVSDGYTLEITGYKTMDDSLNGYYYGRNSYSSAYMMCIRDLSIPEYSNYFYDTFGYCDDSNKHDGKKDSRFDASTGRIKESYTSEYYKYINIGDNRKYFFMYNPAIKINLYLPKMCMDELITDDNYKVTEADSEHVLYTYAMDPNQFVPRPSINPTWSGASFYGWGYYDEDGFVSAYMFNNKASEDITLIPLFNASVLKHDAATHIGSESSPVNTYWATKASSPTSRLSETVNDGYTPIYRADSSTNTYFYTYAGRIYIPNAHGLCSNSYFSYVDEFLNPPASRNITLDTSACTTMQSMFAQSTVTASNGIDLSSWDMSNVTDMHNMFSYCSASKVNLGGRFTSDSPKLVDISEMFAFSTVREINGFSDIQLAPEAITIDLLKGCTTITSTDFLNGLDLRNANCHFLFNGSYIEEIIASDLMINWNSRTNVNNQTIDLILGGPRSMPNLKTLDLSDITIDIHTENNTAISRINQLPISGLEILNLSDVNFIDTNTGNTLSGQIISEWFGSYYHIHEYSYDIPVQLSYLTDLYLPDGIDRLEAPSHKTGYISDTYMKNYCEGQGYGSYESWAEFVALPALETIYGGEDVTTIENGFFRFDENNEHRLEFPDYENFTSDCWLNYDWGTNNVQTGYYEVSVPAAINIGGKACIVEIEGDTEPTIKYKDYVAPIKLKAQIPPVDLYSETYEYARLAINGNDVDGAIDAFSDLTATSADIITDIKGYTIPLQAPLRLSFISPPTNPGEYRGDLEINFSANGYLW